MPVRKRGNAWYVRFQANGQRIERSLGGSASKAEALEYEASLRRDLVSGKLGKAPSRTIDESIQRWLEGEAAGLKSYNNLLSIIRAIVPFTKGRPLSAIVQVAEAMKSEYIKEGLAPATINRRLAALRRIANLAHNQWEWLDLPLGNRIKLLNGEKHRHIYLTPEQVEELATKCRSPIVATVIRLAARTGLRENEILQASTIYDGYIVVEAINSKNQRPRLVPVPIDMQDLTLPLGVTYGTLRTFFEDAREAAGLPWVRFHDLRHTAASWWAKEGASAPILRDLLGHSNLAVTSRYTHLMAGNLKAFSKKLQQERGKDGGKP